MSTSPARSRKTPSRDLSAPVPPPPEWPRPEWLVLEDRGGALGLALWRALRDVLLWNACDPSDRRELFRPPGERGRAMLDRALGEAPDLERPLRELAAVSSSPGTADAARVAAACEEVWMWAEFRGLREVGLQFAEAAARLEPEASSRSYTAGRLCRIAAAHDRAVLWFRRAGRLARIHRSNIDYAIAHLGWGVLEHDRGNLGEAERRFLRAKSAALRNGRKSLAAAAHHDLLAVCIDSGKIEEAMAHAEAAVDLYPATHPRFPFFAHDVGYIWMRMGYFSAAIYLFARILPWIELAPPSALALFARSAAAVRDRIRFERLAARVLDLIVDGGAAADVSLFHLAEGARSFEQWERAEQLVARSLELARIRSNTPLILLAESLSNEILDRKLGDIDTIPKEGDGIERITLKLLTKLKKQPAPESVYSGTVLLPERYPTD